MTVHRIPLALLAILTLTLPASADEARGRIARVDPDKKEIQLEGRGPDRGGVMTFTLDARTQVFVGAKVGAVADLAPGRRARVLFERHDGKAVAQVIHTLRPLLAPRQGAAPPRRNLIPQLLQALRRADELLGGMQGRRQEKEKPEKP